MRSPRILVYDDAMVYGGHELMLTEAVRGLVQLGGARVVLMIDQRNQLFRQRIAELAIPDDALTLATIGGPTPSVLASRLPIGLLKLAHAHRMLQQIRPDVMIVAQGGISLGNEAFLAARATCVRTVSYVALAHATLGDEGCLKAPMKRLAAGLLSRLPNAFVTVCEAMKRLLIERHVRVPVFVVHNGIDVSRCVRRDRAEARRRLGFGDHEFLLGLMGRLECRQKAQDHAIDCLPDIRARMAEARLVIVGDGPDRERLRQQIARSGQHEWVKLVGWQADPSWIYSALDVLIVPSRFEGEPLVMLEAMAYELPVVATAVDGMAEILPKEWLVPVGEREAMVDAVWRTSRRTDLEIIRANSRRIRREFSLERFRRSFCDAVEASMHGEAGALGRG